MLWLPIDSGVYWSTVIRIDEPFLLCYSEADMESDGLKLVLFAHTFVTCFTARFFLTRYGIDMQCVTKVLRSNYRIRKIDKENHESSLEFIIYAKEFSGDKTLILSIKLLCYIIDLFASWGFTFFFAI